MTTIDGTRTAEFVPYVPRLVIELDAGNRPHHIAFPGSLAFVDISGFTALSERLASHGRVGAEVITSTMTTAFTALLTTADHYGGDLLKFGGDALLLLFRGEAHLERAAAAVASMHDELTTVGKIRTEGGRVELGMSAGLATGVIDIFTVGESHREVVISGPVADQLAAAESEAGRGETGLSRTAAALLPNNWLVENGNQTQLRHDQATAEGVQRTTSMGIETDVTRFVPGLLRMALGTMQDDGEHRTACIGFAKITGLNNSMAQSPERAASDLHAVISAIAREADRHRVTFLATDLTSDGTKAILAAGVPQSFGDGVERMVRTARAVVSLDLPLPVRFGVNAGHLFAGDVGAPFRRTYTVMGDTVNLAARLVERAGHREVLATTETIERARSRFALAPVEPFFVKGKTEPIRAALVGEPGDEIEVTDDLPMIGRDEELRVFTAAIDGVRAGRGSAVQVVAEAGMGKSRLLREVRGRSRDLRTFTVVSDEYTTATPFVAIRRLLRALLGVDQNATDRDAGAVLTASLREHDDLLPWAPLLATAMEADVEATAEVERLDPKFRSTQTSRAISGFLTRTLTEPTHIVFEDAHWMDRASAEVISVLIERVAAVPWLITMTRRPGTSGLVLSGAASVTTLELKSLEASAARVLIEQASTEVGILDSDLVRLISQADGHPMFLLELVAAMKSDHGSELPGSVEGLVSQRIDRLEPKSRRFLRALAVIGRRFSEEVVERTLDDYEVELDAAWPALEAFLERIDADIQFKHAIVRDTAYAGLSYRRRRAIHGRVARVLEQEPDALDETTELLSLHYLEAGEYESAWRYAVEAGVQAADRFASADAARFFDRAIRASRRVRGLDKSSVADVAERLGDACDLAGMFEECRAAYTLAHRNASEPTDAIRLMMKRGLVDERLGRYPQALRMLRRALTSSTELTDADAQRIRLEVHVAYAGVRFRQGRYRECVRWCREALAGAATDGQGRERAHAYYLLDHSLALLGEKRDDRYAEQAISIFEEIEDYLRLANVLNNLGVEAYNDGRWTESLQFQSRHRDARQHAGDAVGASIAAYNVGLVQSDQGRYDEARDSFTETLRTCRAANYSAGVAAATAGLGHMEAMAGDPMAGMTLLEEAIAMFEDLGAEYFTADARLRLAETHLVAGNHDAAESVARNALDSTQRLEGVDATLAGLNRVIGYCAGSPADAAARFSEALTLARSDHATYEVLLALEGLIDTDPTHQDHRSWILEVAQLRSSLGILHTPAFAGRWRA